MNLSIYIYMQSKGGWNNVQPQKRFGGGDRNWEIRVPLGVILVVLETYLYLAAAILLTFGPANIDHPVQLVREAAHAFVSRVSEARTLVTPLVLAALEMSRKFERWRDVRDDSIRHTLKQLQYPGEIKRRDFVRNYCMLAPSRTDNRYSLIDHHCRRKK